ncbi:MULTISPECIES: nucleoside 2-deoxyribosyltransferase domain-containing protein [unclassified Streptomyces]|uniref:nucleoside 2-deoxyribosyltransferase domain-containing protein n=1 Tax=unclassified Streptomyces TaxID=2593676 RepID=UPI00190773F3|nr:nucleoside 2-deoxyribosyltransferase domain-containing protein [Streptomyces sp. HSG2]
MCPENLPPTRPRVDVVHVGREAPESWTAAVYLCGPTPTDPATSSWRPDAVAALRSSWTGAGRLVVFLPEPPADGAYPAYSEQVAWEEDAMRRADVVLFWIPRHLPRLPGLVSNVKWGSWCDSGRAVLGTPPEAHRMEYLLHFAEALGVPVASTIEEAAGAALRSVGSGGARSGGERAIPLTVWRTDSFRTWYHRRVEAGDRILDARVDWYSPPSARDGASWLLTATILPGAGGGPTEIRVLEAQGRGVLI